MVEWLRRWPYRDMKCTVHDPDVIVSNPGQVKLRILVFLLGCT